MFKKLAAFIFTHRFKSILSRLPLAANLK